MKSFYLGLILAFSLARTYGQFCFKFDSTFGTKGRVYDLNTEFLFEQGIKKVMVQPDQKIILLAAIYNGSANGIGIKRYTSNGQPDLTFGTEGRVYSTFGGSFYPKAGMLQKDQKIVVAGNHFDNIGIARYNHDGTMDQTFGKAGLVSSSFSWYSDEVSSMAIQPDGKVVLAFNSYDEIFRSGFAVARYLANGSVDSTFGSNGRNFIRVGPLIDFIGKWYYGSYANEYTLETLIQPDGKVLVLGNTYTSCFDYDYYGGPLCHTALAMLRFTPDGKPDSTFGTSGIIVDQTFYSMTCAELQEDGKILIGGSGNKGRFMTARFHPDGRLDKSFAVDGIINFNIPPIGLDEGPTDMVLTKDGRIILLGNTYGQNNKTFVVAYYSDGTPVDPLANKNSLKLEFGTSPHYNFGLATSLQGDQLLVAGLLADAVSSELLFYRLSNIVPKPEIHFTGTHLQTTAGYANYQWFLNGIPLTGNDTHSTKPVQNGIYQVKVSNSDGCSSTSDEFNHLFLASEDIFLGKVSLRYYPNPVMDKLHIDVMESNGNKIQASLYELNGKLVHQQILNQASNTISIQAYSSGVYLLRFKTGKEIRTAKLMVK